MTTPTVADFIEPKVPSFTAGQRVVALCDLLNDGTHPKEAPDALLVPAGAVGEVINVGHAPEANEPIYLVEFGKVVVGCTDDELAPAPMGWLPVDDGPAT